MDITQPPQPPPYILAKDEIKPTILRHVEQHGNLVGSLVSASKVSEATFDNLIRPLADLENLQSGEQAIIAAIKYFAIDPQWQREAEDAEQYWDHYYAQQKPKLYQLFQQTRQTKQEGLDAESIGLLDRMISDCVGNGIGKLTDTTFQERQQRINKISELCYQMNRNLREYDGGEWFSAEEVDGVPLANQEVSPNDRSDGKAFYKHMAKYSTIMRHANSSKTRRQMLEGRHACLAENATLLRQLIPLRDEHARELGFGSHAETKLPSRCVESLEWVENMLDELEKALLPFGQQTYERVKGRKRKFLQRGLGSRITDALESDLDEDCLTQWEYLYYDTMQDLDQWGSQADDDADEEAPMAEWFPLECTFNAMLELFSDCLQIRFEPMSDDEMKYRLWHQDVMAWHVWDERNAHFLGYLYADLLRRPYKYKGNQSVNLQPGYEKADKTRVFPANILMCNFTKGSPETGCLLEHSSVVTLFHELGHSIHDLVAWTKYAKFHGYNVSLELGEGIGMMLEQWCWLPEEVKILSCHYASLSQERADKWCRDHAGRRLPPKQIPISRLEKHFARKMTFKSNKVLGMLIPTRFDLAVHHIPTREALLRLDEAQLYRDIYKRLKFREIPTPSYEYAQNGLLTSGYDAGYYAYICAEVLAADFFQSNFAQDPRSRQAWNRFREGILEKGGSQDELSVIKQFLEGRSIDTRAFLSLLPESTNYDK